MELCACLTICKGDRPEIIVSVACAEEGVGLAEERFDVISLPQLVIAIVKPFFHEFPVAGVFCGSGYFAESREEIGDELYAS